MVLGGPSNFKTWLAVVQMFTNFSQAMCQEHVSYPRAGISRIAPCECMSSQLDMLMDWSELCLNIFRREEERLARLEAAKAYVEADWIRESEAAADDYTSEDEAAYLEQFECVACDKIFKSEKALTNHTRSVTPATLDATFPWHTPCDTKAHKELDQLCMPAILAIVKQVIR